MKVAIVHDWLSQSGGAEQVLEVLHQMYPQAPIYTSVYVQDRMPPAYRRWDIRTSFMQRIPLVKNYLQPFFFLYPLAFQRMYLADYDLVISNSSGFCHGVVVSPSTCHINYCLTPPRFLWNVEHYLEREQMGSLLKQLLPWLVRPLRDWDFAVAQRVSHFVGISQAVVGRIKKCYGRDAALIYPPVDTSRFSPTAETDDYFLIVSRLVPYKRVDLAVRAFNELGLPLLIVGEGRDRKALEAMAQPNIRFLGRFPFADVQRLLPRCRAFIFPGEEDFGIAPLEAQAAGRPVIAYAAGGALETVIDGETGLFFTQPTPESLIEAILRFQGKTFDSVPIRRHAERFDTRRFIENLGGFVARQMAAHHPGATLVGKGKSDA